MWLISFTRAVGVSFEDCIARSLEGIIQYGMFWICLRYSRKTSSVKPSSISADCTALVCKSFNSCFTASTLHILLFLFSAAIVWCFSVLFISLGTNYPTGICVYSFTRFSMLISWRFISSCQDQLRDPIITKHFHSISLWVSVHDDWGHSFSIPRYHCS